MVINLKRKKVLITAGPTWVPIDKVRVIGNLATGKTGVLLAEKFAAAGAKVTLLLGPVQSCCLDKKIRVLRFTFFDELANVFTGELRSHKYDIVIHAAAVSDYRPHRFFNSKLSSSKKNLRLDLVPTAKLVDRIKKISPFSLAVAFKFEPGAGAGELIDKASVLLRRSRMDLVVANNQSAGKYQAFIVDKCGSASSKIKTKTELVKKLIGLLI